MTKYTAFAFACALGACVQTDKPADPNEETQPTGPGDVIVPPSLSPDTTFTATLRVEDVDGGFPSASLVYEGTTYATNDKGLIVIPNVTLAKAGKGLSLNAPGFMPRSVAPQYHLASSAAGLRVVLERAGATVQFNSALGGAISNGPVNVTFAVNSFLDSTGAPYTGEVKVAALGTNPVNNIITFDANGPFLRQDFDIARIPQGFGLAGDADGSARFFLPESLFQVELTTASGDPLTLSPGAPATFKLALSDISTHTLGDVIATYRFDTTAQRWQEEGTCTVELQSDSTLACVGTTTHFSYWTVPSGSNSTEPYCGNVKYRVFGASGQVEVKTKALFERESLTEKPTNAVGRVPPERNAGGTCFFQASEYANVTVTVVVTDGSDKKEYDVRVGPGEAVLPGTPSNLHLTKHPKIVVKDLEDASLEKSCLSCPVTIVDIDLTGKTPVVAGACDPSCGPASTCVSGVCRCDSAALQYKGQIDGCTTPSCPVGQLWDESKRQCVKPCDASVPPCDSMATCANNDGAATATCTCAAGYAGAGTPGACANIDACVTAPCSDPLNESCADLPPPAPSNDTGRTCSSICQLSSCAIGALCTPVSGAPSCACPPGTSGNAAAGGTCTNIDACLTDPCLMGELCSDLPPPAVTGLVGRVCGPDECVASPYPCDVNAACADTAGASPTCACVTNYLDTGVTGPPGLRCSRTPGSPNNVEGIQGALASTGIPADGVIAVDFRYIGSGQLLSSVLIDGIESLTNSEGDVQLFGASGNLITTAGATLELGFTEVLLDPPVELANSADYRLAFHFTASASLRTFTPAASTPYEDVGSPARVRFNQGYRGSALNTTPTTDSTDMPQVMLFLTNPPNACNANPCDARATCTPSGLSYTCDCAPNPPPVGYETDGAWCGVDAPSGPGLLTHDLVTGSTGFINSPVPTFDATFGVEFTVAASGSQLNGVIVDGFTPPSALEVRLYDATASLSALASGTSSVISPRMQVDFGMPKPVLSPGTTYMIAVYIQDVAPQILTFTPSAFPSSYTTQTGGISVLSGHQSMSGPPGGSGPGGGPGGGFVYPSQTSSSIPQLTLVTAPAP